MAVYLGAADSQIPMLWLAANLEKKEGLDALLAFADTRAYTDFLEAKALTFSAKAEGDLLVLFAQVLANSAKSASSKGAWCCFRNPTISRAMSPL